LSVNLIKFYTGFYFNFILKIKFNIGEKMSILEKYEKVFNEKDEAGMNEILHDDFKFTMHSSGNMLSKSDVIGWAMSDDINEEKVRVLYENDEIGVRHNFVTFKDGNTQAVMAVFMFRDGKIVSMETGATNIPK
jgi:hypothetical protein